MAAIDTIINILWKTPEGKACQKAIKYFNNHFDQWTKKEVQEKIKIFEKKFDKPLNKRWAELKKQYRIKEKLK
jgi:hypothetical protein